MQEVNLYLLLKYYAKKWLVILILTVLGLAAGWVYNNYLQVPLYKSNATLLLISPNGRQAAQDTTLINNYVELFKSRRVLEPVIKAQKLDISYGALVSSIEAKNEKGTEVIKVAVSTGDAKISRKVVEGAVLSFKEQVNTLYGVDNVQIVDNASLSTRPYNINTLMQLAISTAAGFIVAVTGLFFAYDFGLNRKSTKKAIAKDNIDETIASVKTPVKKPAGKKRKTLKQVRAALATKVKSLLGRAPKAASSRPKKAASKPKKAAPKKAKRKPTTKK